MELYAVDDIVRPIACSLVISYGITIVLTLEATGLVILGNIHCQHIPDEYTKVKC